MEWIIGDEVMLLRLCGQKGGNDAVLYNVIIGHLGYKSSRNNSVNVVGCHMHIIIAWCGEDFNQKIKVV